MLDISIPITPSVVVKDLFSPTKTIPYLYGIVNPPVMALWLHLAYLEKSPTPLLTIFCAAGRLLDDVGTSL